MSDDLGRGVMPPSEDAEDVAYLNQVLQSIVALVTTSLQYRTVSPPPLASDPQPFNADSAILLTLPTLLRSLQTAGFEVSESVRLADASLIISLLSPALIRARAISIYDIETAHALIETLGLTGVGGPPFTHGAEENSLLVNFFSSLVDEETASPPEPEEEPGSAEETI